MFINGPHLVQPMSGLGGLDGPDVEKVDDNTPIEEQPRAWWMARDDGTYDGWDTTVSFLNAQLAEHGPFDAILGFSQGACYTGLLASAFEDPSRMPGLELPPGQGKLRFAIAISGFRSREPRHERLYAQKIETPMLCVLGKEDYIVDSGKRLTAAAPVPAQFSRVRKLTCRCRSFRRAERSKTLTDVCANVRVEWHEGGHATPSQAPWRNFFRDFLTAFQQEQDGPTAAKLDWKTLPGPSDRSRGTTAPSSANASGTSTPTGTGKTLADMEREEEEAERREIEAQKPSL